MSSDLFRNKLLAYINYGAISRKGVYLTAVGAKSHSVSHAAELSCEYDLEKNPCTVPSMSQIDIEVEKYKGSNPFVLRMSEFLQKELGSVLAGAYVHGSLGTYEEVKFSDFDALVIIKDKVLATPERLADTVSKLHESLGIMYDFDPLQHHGWFVLTEFDLRCYPQYYFPQELFSCAKTLIPGKGAKFTVLLPGRSTDIHLPFANLADSVCNRVGNSYYPRNMYELKSLLSQFMLLPALYVQARDGKGIFKKYSFDAVKKDFSPDTWKIMDEVSSIREKWHYEITPLQKFIMTKPSFLARKLSRKVAPKIPESIQTKLTKNFYGRMVDLATSMKESLNRIVGIFV